MVKLEWVLLVFSVLHLTSGCKPDTSTHSVETEAYLADYESPPHSKWGFIDKTGALAIKPVYDEVNLFSEGFAAVNQKGKWGYIDLAGNVTIPLAYKSAWAFHEHRARIKPFDRTDCYIHNSGVILSSGTWSAAGDFSEGLALVSVGTTFGYIDTTGNMVIPPVYSRGQNFHRGLAVIELEEKSGVINTAGEKIIPAQFDRISMHAKEGIILCNNDKTAIAFDLAGKELTKLENTTMIDTDGKLISIIKEDIPSFYDLKNRKMRSSERFTNIVYLSEHRWAGKRELGYYLLDEEGKKISNIAYSQINNFIDGMAVYSKDQGWGYIDLTGKELSGNEFKLAWDYKEGLARAAFEQGIAFIDRQQKIAFYPTPGTLDMRDFSEGLAPVEISR